MAVLNAHGLFSERVQLRDVLHPAGIRHGRTQGDMQLHQKVRADWNVKTFGQMRHFQPGCDAADARHIHLHNRAGAALQILAEMQRAVEAYANCNGQRCTF